MISHRWSARGILTLVLLASIVALLHPVPARAARVFHVAPDGNDDAPGTQEAPWGTISESFEKLRAGDTLVLGGGRYVERIGNGKPLPRGTVDSPIVVQAAAGERPVIEGGMTLQVGGPHHWIFDGLEFVWSDTLASSAALVRMVDGVGWEIRNSRIHGNRSYAALRVMAETPGLATGWAVRDSCIHSTATSNGPNNDHNVYVGADSRSGVAAGPGVIERNMMYGAPNGANLKLGPGEPHLPGTRDVVVRGNVMGGAPQNVILAWGSHDNRIEANVLLQQHNGTWSQPWYPNVRGIDLTGGDNVAVRNTASSDAAIVDTWGSPAQIHDAENVSIELDPGTVADPCSDLPDPDAVARVAGPDAILDRVAGASRIDTAARLATTWSGAETVVVARGDAYADALAGAPLAGHLGAPLLLTDRHRLSAEAAAQIRRLGAEHAVLLGGTGALLPQVARDLRGLGLSVDRVAGADRFDTATEVARRLPATDEVFMVEGANALPSRGWPDAVALSALAASTATPIVLTMQDALPDASRALLRELGDETAVTVVGGEIAVSNDVVAAVAATGAQAPRPVTRISGRDRYDTSAQVGAVATSRGADASDVWLVTGQNWPDALAAGPAAAAAGATMLLVHGQDARHSPAVLSWLWRRADVDDLRLTVVGGAGAVSPSAVVSLAYGLS